MNDTTAAGEAVQSSAAPDLAPVDRMGWLLSRIGGLLESVRLMADAVDELLPNTTDEDKARAVLRGQAAVCDTMAEILEMAHREAKGGAA